ncbi:hypothetical protein [Xanthobacter sp. KR7-225]|uniref:hypothetical protein n=1 Tax=Xanthobacter sp. KR7-225 TaxID=3156613 RepID=UPI0032B5E7D9
MRGGPSSEEVCRDIYQETRALYARHSSALGEHDFGFRILYGPPLVHAPILFLGLQPGGGRESASAGRLNGEHEGWPLQCDYATADWDLAERLRGVWTKTCLHDCTGLNVNFFRAPSARDWRRVPRETRTSLEKFCLERAETIVRALAPQRMVVLGLGTLPRLTDAENVALGEGGRILARKTHLWGAPTFSVLHPTGAWLRRGDRRRLNDHLQTEIPRWL